MKSFPNRRAFLRAAFGGVAGVSLMRTRSGTAFAQAAPIEATRLSGNLVLWTGAGANVLAMTGSDGVVMVDGGLAERSPALLEAASGPSGGGLIHTLFNTHWHPEQTGSNLTLGNLGRTIIAHENTRLWLTTDITRPWDNLSFKPPPPAARPNETFYTTGTTGDGAERIDYGYMLQAHTDGDIYVFFPESNVLAIGDVISGDGWPFIDWWTGGWIDGLVSGLETLLDVADAETRVVPAQGPVLNRADLEFQHEMFGTISQRLRAIMYSGKSPDDAIAEQATLEFNDRMGHPDDFIRMAFQSMWAHLTPDA